MSFLHLLGVDFDHVFANVDGYPDHVLKKETVVHVCIMDVYDIFRKLSVGATFKNNPLDYLQVNRGGIGYVMCLPHASLGRNKMAIARKIQQLLLISLVMEDKNKERKKKKKKVTSYMSHGVEWDLLHQY